MTKTTCILYFSRTPEEESKHKRLSPSSSGNKQIHKELYKHGLNVIHKSTLPFVLFTEEKQRGKSFGERISHAISEVFQKYDSIIVIGSDCPDLSVSDIVESRIQLLEGNQVIGLEHDGGAYLFGLLKDNFDKESFTKLPWNSGNLGESLKEYLENDTSTIALGSKTDIDTEGTFIYLINSGRYLTHIWKRILNIWAKAISIFTDIIHHFTTFSYNIIRFRGPPII